MAGEERLLGIRARYTKESTMPLGKKTIQIFTPINNLIKIPQFGEIHITQQVNDNFRGEVIVRNGTTFEQPSRIEKFSMSSMNGQMSIRPFSLCPGESIILKKGKVTVEVVNRKHPKID